MNKMEKICPDCNAKLKEESKFCTGCGADVQDVEATIVSSDFEEIKETASNVAGSAIEWIKDSMEGVSFTHFIPLVTTILGIWCLAVGDWLKNAYAETTHNLKEFIAMSTMWGDIPAELVDGVFVVGTIAAVVGSVFLILQKTFGKILYYIGAGVTLAASVGLAVLFALSNPYFLESSAAYFEKTNELLYCPQIGFILFVAASIAGLVFASKSDT